MTTQALLVRNGYYNPDRSEKLNYWLNHFSRFEKKNWEVKSPLSCTEKKETMAYVAKVILIVGVLLAGTAVVEGILFQAYPLAYSQTGFLLITISGGVALAGCFTAAMVLFFKPYWNDPAFREMRREEIIQQCINGSYRPKQEDKKYKLLTKAERVAITIDRAHRTEARRDYCQLLNDRKFHIINLIKKGKLDPKLLTPLLCEEIRDNCDGNLRIFIEKYGWQPFEDRIIDANSLIPLFPGVGGEPKTVREYFRESIRVITGEYFREEFESEDRLQVALFDMTVLQKDETFNTYDDNGRFQLTLEDKARWEGYGLFTAAEEAAVAIDLAYHNAKGKKEYQGEEGSCQLKDDKMMLDLIERMRPKMIPDLIRKKMIDPKWVVSLLLEKIRDTHGNLCAFVKEYGWQPFEDRIIDANSLVPLYPGEKEKPKTIMEYFSKSIESDLNTSEDIDSFNKLYGWSGSWECSPLLRFDLMSLSEALWDLLNKTSQSTGTR